ncbi:hypothetical protein THRCLA_07992, partial [Thraustotheca clavata]
MDIALLGNSTYVEERYKELRRKQPEDHSSPGLEVDLGEGISATQRFHALLQPKSCSSTLPSLLEDQIALKQTVKSLETMWPVSFMDKKHTLLYLLLEQLAVASRTNKLTPLAIPGKDMAVDPCDSLPVSTQLAVKMFFKLIQSVRTRCQASGNFNALVRLIEQIPRMLVDLPALALRPDTVACDIPTVFDEIFSTVIMVLPQLPDKEASLTALVGLSIKRGRLEQLLIVLQHLLRTDPTLELPLALPFLQELSQAKPQPPECPKEEQSTVGFLLSFGKGDHGKLGHGSCNHASCADNKCTENKTVPTMIEATRDIAFKKIDSLSTHSVAITVSGELMTWGNGDKYRLGHGDASKEYAPRYVEAFRDKPRVKDVACGLGHTIVLVQSGEVYSWGNGGNGRLGLGDTSDQIAPSKVKFPDELDKRNEPFIITTVYCGASHSLAITQQGHLYSWGKNNQGQTGHGHTNDQLRPYPVSYFDDADQTVLTVAGGWEHTLICTTQGHVYACGCGYKDSRRAGLPPVLGLGVNDTDRRTTPTIIPGLENCTVVACGWDHSLAITRDGDVYSWGSGSNGKLGHGDEENRGIPTKIMALQGKGVRNVRAGCEHTTAITNSGDMYTWGHSDSGRLGHGDNITRKTPCYVESFAWQGVRPVAIAVGDKYNLVLVQRVSESTTSVSNNNQVQTEREASTPRMEYSDLTSLTVEALLSAVIEQLDRLAQTYVPKNTRALLEKLKKLHFHPTPSLTNLAYVVDVSAETFQLLYEILLASFKPDDNIKVKKFSIIRTCLTLIESNLCQFLSCPNVPMPPTLIQNLHELLQDIAMGPSSLEAIGAARALKIGFPFFYPTAVAQHELLWRLVAAPQGSQFILLDALTDQLCQDHVMVALMSRVFAKHHTCAADEPSASDGHITMDESLNYIHLRQLMLSLLKQCTNHDTSQEVVMQLQLRTLAALQTHLFSAWNMPNVYCTNCITLALSPYLEALLTSGATLLRTVHKRLLKDSDLSMLQSSFFHVLAPVAIECCCVSPLRSNMTIGIALLPLLLPILKILDEVSYVSKQNNCQANHSLDMTWIHDLGTSTAVLAGKYACALMASSQGTNILPGSFSTSLKWLCRYGLLRNDNEYPSVLRSWEEQGVYEIEHELQNDTNSDEVSTILLDHTAISDWLQGKGLLHDFHQYMVFHLTNSWSLATLDIPDAVCAIMLWHSGLVTQVLQFASSLNFTNPIAESTATKPPEVIYQLYVLIAEVKFDLNSYNLERVEENCTQLLKYAPSLCSWTLESSDTLPETICSWPHCSNLVPLPCTLSIRVVMENLSNALHWTSKDDCDEMISFKIAGITIMHDLLRKLTSTTAKCELLRILMERMEVSEGSLMISYNAWQEPCVVFCTPQTKSSPTKLKRHKKDMISTPLEMIERDMHTYHGARYNAKLLKAIENLFVRLVKIIASDHSNVHLKTRAMSIWTVQFHDVSIIRRAGILHILGDMLGEMADISSSFSFTKTLDTIHSGVHGGPGQSCLPLHLRPVERLISSSTTFYNLHITTWHVFAWLSKQLMQSKEVVVPSSPSNMSLSRPSSAKSLSSPRKRLSLPFKLISSSLEQSISHLYQVVIVELTKVQNALQQWNNVSNTMAQCLEDSQTILLADPQVVTSTNVVFLSAKEKPAFDANADGLSISLWLYIEQDDKITKSTGLSTPLLILANGGLSEHQLELTLEGQYHIGLKMTMRDEIKVTSAQSVEWGQWVHLVARFFPVKKTLQLFLNGKLDSTSEIWNGSGLLAPSHHTFTVGGILQPSQAVSPHAPHLIIDDVTFHLHALTDDQIANMGAAGSLLFRIKQRQVLDGYCSQLLALLASKSRVQPVVDNVIKLVVSLFPVAPPTSHNLLFQLLMDHLPAMAPDTMILDFIVDHFAQSWFSSANDVYGPPELSAALTTRKDNCISQLLCAGQLDPKGVAAWLLFEQPNKSKSLRLLRASRSHAIEGFVLLLRRLFEAPLWREALLTTFEEWMSSPDSKLSAEVYHKVDLAKLAPVVLAVYALGGHQSEPSRSLLPTSALVLMAWSLKHSMHIEGHKTTSSSPSTSLIEELQGDICLAKYMHLRTAVLRLCRYQTKDVAVTESLLICEHPVFSGLLSLAITSISDAISKVFGLEFDAVSKLDTVHTLLEWILDAVAIDRSKRLLALETLASVLFERLPYVDPREVAPWWLVNSTQKLHVLGGEVEMEEYRVKGLQHFPTVKLNGVSITAGTGMWFYEVVLLTDGLMQIGWIDTAFEANAIQGQGVGDHTNSWAYDGFRKKKWNVGALDYGDRWRVGDAIGVLLDTDRFEMQYFLNGRPLGIAFEGLHLNHAMFPAISLNVDQAIQLHCTKNQFLYFPTLDNARIQPVANAVIGGVCEHSPSKASQTTDSEDAIDRRRSALIESLVGLGFPTEALRCARETSLELNESSAIAWIMEQMENDVQNRPTSLLHGQTTRQEHLQRLDGLTDFNSIHEHPKQHKAPAETRSCSEDITFIQSNKFLADEYCEEIYLEEGYSNTDIEANQNASDKKSNESILTLADNCRDEEILPLYLIAETVLSIWYAQDSTNQILCSGAAIENTLANDEALFLQYLQHMMMHFNDRTPYQRLLLKICASSQSFFTLLLSEMLGQFQVARAKEFFFTPFVHVYVSVLGQCKAIGGPNLEWSRWLAVTLVMAAKQESRSHELYSEIIWKNLVQAITQSSNATVRHYGVLVLLELTEGLSDADTSLLLNLQSSVYLNSLVEWLATKLRKSKQSRVLASTYIQSIFHLAFKIYKLLNVLPVAQPPASKDISLVIEHITSSTVIVSCSKHVFDSNVSLSLALSAETIDNSGKLSWSPLTDIEEPVEIQPEVSFTIPNLQSDTNYRLCLKDQNDNYTTPVCFQTLNQSVQELDPISMGSNLELLNHNMTVRNRVNKKWHAVRATISYTSGVHTWDVRIDKCISKNIFVGVCTSEASMENYIGSDSAGWGFLANKAVWHNKTKLQTYGDIFKQGDTVSVCLNIDLGTLSFSRNGESFGVAVEHLRENNSMPMSANALAFYPAISMYNKDDQVTFLPLNDSSPDATSAKRKQSGSSFVIESLKAMHVLTAMFGSEE